MNKVVSRKRTSAIFLAIVLVTGTITALSFPPFMTIGAAQAQPYYDEKDSYDDRKSYGKDDRDKSKDSSKSVSINKIKCINDNININGINTGDINVGNNGQLVKGRDLSASSFGENGERYYDDGYNNNKKNKGFDCIINNNNNNTNINLGGGGGNQTIPPDNNVYVVWQNFSNSEIFFTVSRDGGQTFSAPKTISNTAGVSTDPQITSQGDNVYVVWRDNTPGNFDIFFTVSSDGGQTFSTPENISETTAFSENPQISVEGNNVYVVWQDSTSGNPPEVLFAVSDDNGLTFSNPENISNDAGESENPQISSEGNNVYVVWRDTTSEDSDIFFTVSTDNGLTFSTPENLSNTGSASAQQISSEGNNVYVVWQDVAFGSNDIFIAVSDDNGLTFNPPENLSNNIFGSFEPKISSEGNNVYVVWRDLATGSNNVFIAVSDDNGLTFSSPENISNTAGVALEHQISAEGDNVYVVWHQEIAGIVDIFVTVSNDGGLTFSPPENISETPGFSSIPQISSELNNVYVVWRDNIPQTTNTEILFAVSDDNGLTFNPPENLSNDAQESENPQISSSIS